MAIDVVMSIRVTYDMYKSASSLLSLAYVYVPITLQNTEYHIAHLKIKSNLSGFARHHHLAVFLPLVFFHVDLTDGNRETVI